MKRDHVKPEKFVESIAQGKTIREALLDAGKSAKQARKGISAVNQQMMKGLAKEGYRLVALSEQFTQEQWGKIAIGRLIQNAMLGKDGGCLSAKQLGQHRDLQLWQPETVAGVIVLQTPTKISENVGKILEAEE